MMTKQVKRKSTRGNKFQIDETHKGVRILTKLSKQNGFNIVNDAGKLIGKMNFTHPNECLINQDENLLEYLSNFSIWQRQNDKDEYFIYQDKRNNAKGSLHRLIWEFYHHKLPTYKPGGESLTIDHLDGNKWNNKIENLCLMTLRMNLTKTRVVNKNLYPYHLQCAVNPNNYNDYMLAVHLGFLNLQQTIYFRYNNLERFMSDLNRFKGQDVKKRFTDIIHGIILDNAYMDIKDITREPSEKEQQNFLCATSIANALPRPILKMNFSIFNKK